MLIVKILAAWFALSILFAWGWARFWSRPCMQDIKDGE